MSDQQIIVTVSGVDKVGIVAKVATALAMLEVNIEDIKQTIMQGHFVMFLLGNISKSKFTFKEIKEKIFLIRCIMFNLLLSAIFWGQISNPELLFSKI